MQSMFGEPLSPANLATFLVTRWCLPMIAGTRREEPPVNGVPLSPDERAKLGYRDGETIVYPLADTMVFLNLSGPTAAVLLGEGDVGAGLGLLDAALRSGYPALVQREDRAHPHGGKKRLRVYEGDVSPTARAKIEVDYPDADAGAADFRFVVRVTAYQRSEQI